MNAVRDYNREIDIIEKGVVVCDLDMYAIFRFNGIDLMIIHNDLKCTICYIQKMFRQFIEEGRMLVRYINNKVKDLIIIELEFNL